MAVVFVGSGVRLDCDLIGFLIFDGGAFGAFLGLFFGAAAGWIRLVVAVGRESRRRAKVAPNSAQQPTGAPSGARG